MALIVKRGKIVEGDIEIDSKGEMKLAERKVKGRMENIPVDFSNPLPIEANQIEPKETKLPVYFTPGNLYCSCGYLMYFEVKPLEKKIEAYCTSLNCSENLVFKFFDMPSISDYVVSPSQV